MPPEGSDLIFDHRHNAGTARALGIAVRHLECWSNRRRGGLSPAASSAGRSCTSRCLLWGDVRDTGGINVCGGAIRTAAGQVVLHRGTRADVRGGFLHIIRRKAGVQRGGQERVLRTRGEPWRPRLRVRESLSMVATAVPVMTSPGAGPACAGPAGAGSRVTRHE